MRFDDWVDAVTLTLNQPSSVDPLDDAGNRAGSLLDSLVIVARYREVHLSREQLIREHQLDSADVTIAQTLRIAHAAGLRAYAVRLRWEDLLKMGTAVPAIVLLRNGTAMVLMRAATAPSGLPVVVLRDPGGSEDAPLMIDETRFTAGLDRRRHSDQTRLPAARRGSAVRAAAGSSGSCCATVG